MNKYPREQMNILLLFTYVTLRLVADIQICRIPLIVAAEFPIDLIVKFAGPVEQWLIGCRIVPLGLALLARYEILDLENKVPFVVESKKVNKTPVRWSPEHICLDIEIFGFR